MPVDNIDSNIDHPFSLFIEEGGVYGVRKGKDKLKKFIPNTPEQGFDNAFGADSNVFSVPKKKRGRGRPPKTPVIEQRSYF